MDFNKIKDYYKDILPEDVNSKLDELVQHEIEKQKNTTNEIKVNIRKNKKTVSFRDILNYIEIEKGLIFDV